MRKLISTIKGILNYEVSLSDIPHIPPELTSKLSFDDITKKLQFSGVMTAAEKQVLDSLSNDPNDAYHMAVKNLYDNPRTFISKKMRAFELQPFSASLEPLPLEFEFPNDLKNKIYYDPAENKLIFHRRYD